MNIREELVLNKERMKEEARECLKNWSMPTEHKSKRSRKPRNTQKGVVHMEYVDINIPTDYTKLTREQRRDVREKYVRQQKGLCLYCGQSLFVKPPTEIRNKPIDWKLFPKGFLDYPIHLQHDHTTGMTEGAVHAYCNAVMWQYEGI